MYACSDMAYDMDQNLLEERFRDMQRRFHPDKHAAKGADVKRLAQLQSARLNEGYSVLRCPLARAKYIVRIPQSSMQFSVI
jgi:molecular chaperone HscB